MSPNEWVAITVGIVTIVTAFAGSVKWLVKHYLVELKPNSGSSLKDQVNRLEKRVDDIYSLLLDK